MQKVLIITYYWPPGGGAGVQRWLKFAKYLPRSGWLPVVLTIDPDYATYPALDKTLEKDISKEIKVIRTRATDWFRIYNKDKSKVPAAGFAKMSNKSLMEKLSRFIRGNFFIPDPRRGWNRHAYRKACQIISETGIDRVITTSPPHSTQLIGLKLKKKFPGIKWIADFRDPWTDIYYYNRFYPTLPARMLDSFYERKVIRTVDRIITVGQTLKENLGSKISGAENKIEVITNGYDEADFTADDEAAPQKLIISYVGTLSESYPLDGLMEALNALLQTGKDFILRFAGEIPKDLKNLIINKLNLASIEFNPYLGHEEALRFIKGSSVLLLIIPYHRSNKSILTGKLYEYIAAGKPILCIGPVDGDAAGIINETGTGKTFDYNDPDGILNFLLIGKDSFPGDKGNSISRYSRQYLTGKVVKILE